MDLEPNFQLIRQNYPPRRSSTRLDGITRESSEWEGVYKVLEWIYGKKLPFDERLWFIENAPLPLLVLSTSHLSPFLSL